jgi:hypothetical protein
MSKVKEKPLIPLKIRWISSFVLSVIIVLNAIAIEGWASDIWVSVIANTILFFGYWQASLPITRWGNHWFNWKEQLGLKVGYTTVGILITVNVFLGSVELLEYLTGTGVLPTLREYLVNLMLSTLIMGIMTAILYSLRIMRDAQLVEIEQAEEKVEHYYQSLIAEMEDSILVFDEFGKLQFHSGGVAVPNQPKEQPEQLVWVKEEDRPKLWNFIMQQKEAGKPLQSVIYRMDDPIKGMRYIECNAVSAMESPEISGVITTHRDVTSRVAHEKSKAQFESLKNQINPHFLFNSLNVLSSLVHTDAQLSEQFIDQLARSYRYLLEQKESDLVSLQKELDFIHSFTFLLKIRFEDKLRVEIHLPAEVLKATIPPLSLQLLIENAVKHNQLSNEHPLTIRISSTEDGMLEVRNNLQTRVQQLPSTGLGLENIRNRYNLLTSTKPSFNIENDEYIARIPLIYE